VTSIPAPKFIGRGPPKSSADTCDTAETDQRLNLKKVNCRCDRDGYRPTLSQSY
jgi:hypothetical protein